MIPATVVIRPKSIVGIPPNVIIPSPIVVDILTQQFVTLAVCVYIYIYLHRYIYTEKFPYTINAMHAMLDNADTHAYLTLQ